MGFNNPSWTWSELEAALSGKRAGRDGRAPRAARRGTPVATGRRGAASASRSRPTASTARAPAVGAVRRAALPLQLLVPRRCLAPRGAGHRGRPARARGAGPHRPQRVLRRRALRRGGPGGRPADRVRRRDHADARARPPTQQVDAAREAATRRPRSTPGGCPTRHAPDPHGDHLLVLADGPGRLRPAGPGAEPRAPGGGEGGAAVRASPTSPATPAGDVWVLTGCRKGAVPRGAGRRRAGRRAPRAASGWSRRSGATGCSSSCGTTATRSTRPATTRSSSSPPGDGVGVRRHQQRALRHAGPAPAGHRARRGAGPAQPRRDRRVAAGGRRCPPALRGRAGAPLRPLPGRGRAGRRDRPGGGVRPRARRPEPAAVPVSRTGLTEMAVPAPRRRRRGRRRYGDAAGDPARTLVAAGPGVARRSTTSWRSSSSSASPATSSSCGTSSSSAAAANIFCQGRGSAANSAVCYALGVTAADAVSLGLLFERFLSPERDGPPDIDIDIESDRREEVIQYVYGNATAATTRRRSPTSSPTAPRSAIRDMAKALGHAPGQQDAWSKRGRRVGQRVTATAEPARLHGIPQPVLDLAAADRGRAAPPRHPLRRHGHLRPAGDRGVPGRVGADGQALGAAVGQGRLRRGRAREVRPARARDAVGAALRRRPDP